MTQRMGEDQILALALEGRVHAAQGETAQLVALAGNLALLPEPEIDPAFAAALEAQLLTDGLVVTGQPRLRVVQPAPALPAEPVKTNVVQLPRRRVVIKRSLVGIAVAAALAAFPLAMAANSLPGSPFYGLKHAIEKMWDARPGSAMDLAFRHLGRANEHLAEAAQLANDGNKTGEEDALKMAQDEMNDARSLVSLNKSNPVDLSKFNDFLTKTENRMTALQQQLDGPPPTINIVPSAAPRSATVKTAPPASNPQTVGDVANTTTDQTNTQIKHAKKTGDGSGLHQVEGCHPPLQHNLDPYNAGDTFAFTCRQGVGLAQIIG